VVPDVRSGWLFASSVRTATVMASPVTIALATRWITDGTAVAFSQLCNKSRWSASDFAAILPRGHTAPVCGLSPLAVAAGSWTSRRLSGLARTGIGVVAATPSRPMELPEAVRVCLGGPAERSAVRGALEFMAHALTESPTLASTYL
jgi:hypothetical protein